MSEFRIICTLCLAQGVKTFDIAGTRYEALLVKNFDTNITVQRDTRLLACYMCYQQLRKFYNFLQRSQESYQLLTQASIETNSLELKCLSTFDITQTSIINISDTRECNSAEVKLEYVKEETNNCYTDIDKNDDYLQQDDNIDSIVTDSEDDIPLQRIQSNKIREGIGKQIEKRTDGRKREIGVKKKEGKRGLKANFIEIILSKEEQLKAMEQRARSMNYINAAMKCDKCYKGFVDTAAFENHKRRHDESSGAHSCEICGLRYTHERQLTAHVTASHRRRYRCVRCQYLAATAHQARAHEKWHRGHIYDCKLCGDQFSKPTSFLTHVRKRHPSSQWCTDCGAGFVSERGLVMHRAKAHLAQQPIISAEPASERFCEDCNVLFSSKDAWNRHILTSVKHNMESQDSTECRICKTKFPCVSSLALHRKTHMKAIRSKKISATFEQVAIKLKCEQCGALFINKSKLQRHINRTHLGIKYDKNIVCEICSKKCTSNASLRYHQRTHSGERPFSCTSCPKRFANSHQLSIHNRTHTGEKPYCCGVCGKRFTQKAALNRHDRIHTGVKPYKCQYCTMSFSQSNTLKNHTRALHSKMRPTAKKNKPQILLLNSKET